jgi:hypothetical protein
MSYNLVSFRNSSIPILVEVQNFPPRLAQALSPVRVKAPVQVQAEPAYPRLPGPP